jgi:peptide deformylase
MSTRAGEQIHEEGCLSVPGIYANVKRAEDITIKAQDVDGNTFEERLEGLHAVCIQHEMDHLVGRLFVDYLSPLKRNMVKKKLEKQRKAAAKEAADHHVM